LLVNGADGGKKQHPAILFVQGMHIAMAVVMMPMMVTAVIEVALLVSPLSESLTELSSVTCDDGNDES
jgi:hypothetical protein